MNKANEPYPSKGGKNRKEGFSYKKTFPTSCYDRVEIKYSSHNKKYESHRNYMVMGGGKQFTYGLGEFFRNIKIIIYR